MKKTERLKGANLHQACDRDTCLSDFKQRETDFYFALILHKIMCVHVRVNDTNRGCFIIQGTREEKKKTFNLKGLLNMSKPIFILDSIIVP